MRYFITFLEGIVSFISPCMLPMLPVYIGYFTADGDTEREDKKNIFARALSFVLGFTLVFTALGLFAGTLGGLLTRFRTAVNIVCGALVILFGLSYLEVIPLRFLKGLKSARNAGSVLSAFVFGMIYSVSLTPCVGAFLGSALMLAASAGGAAKGAVLLLVYSMGLGIPFVLSAVLLDRLRGTFGVIKRHYKVINTVCGAFLIVVGVFMMSGLLNKLISVFA